MHYRATQNTLTLYDVQQKQINEGAQGVCALPLILFIFKANIQDQATL